MTHKETLEVHEVCTKFIKVCGNDLDISKACRSTWIDPAPKNRACDTVGAGRTWMDGQVAVWIHEENGSFRVDLLLVVSLLVFDGEELHCFGASSP